MNDASRTKFCWRLLWVAWAVVASPAVACTACFGQSDSAMAQGMNWGIYTLLGVIGTVLVCVASAFVAVGRRSSQPSRSHSTLSDS